MPKPNPIDIWEDLLRDAVSSDDDERENALFQIGLILERHNRPNPDAPELYESHLPRELLRLVLPDVRQKAAVVYLAKLVETQPDDAASALYAMRRAKPIFYIEPLLQLLVERGKQLKTSAAYEAAEALLTVAKQPPSTLKDLLKAHDPSALLDIWAEGKDDELADKADWALEKLEPYLPSDGEAE
jgi:hypothetical protein